MKLNDTETKRVNLAMRKKIILISLTVGAWCLPYYSSSETLVHEFQSSLTYDAKYREAKANYNSAKESKLAAWSAFFPQVTGSGNLLTNYNANLSSSFSVSAQQTIFNWGAIRQVSVANAQVRQAVAALSAAEQDLMQRVAQGYFAVIRANELLQVMQAQFDTMGKQLAAVHARYQVGHATITDLDRVKASHDLYRAQLLTLKIKLAEEKQALSQMTGHIIQSIPRLKSKFAPIKPKPADLQVWQEKANQQNLTLRAASEAVQVAKANIGVQRGGYLPTVSLTGAYYTNKYYNTGKNLIYGLNVSFNAFQGGYTWAQVGQAQAQYQGALAQRDTTYRAVISNMKNAFNGMLNGVEQIKIEKLALDSNQSALKHTEAGYIAGTQTILDVLDQQNKLFEAERTYVDGRINYLNNIVLLELAAGTLKPLRLASIQTFL